MRHRWLWIAVIAIELVSAGHAATNPGDIPFKLVQGFAIVVRGGIGLRSDLNFLMDTGAVPSVLGEHLASALGLRGEVGSLDVLHKRGQARYVTIEVRLGNTRPVRLGMVVVDLAPLQKALGIRIDAVIGLDLFAGQSLSIDYAHRRITPGSSGDARRSVPVEIDTAAGAPYIVVPVIVNGHAMRLLLDTGTNGLTLFVHHGPARLLDAQAQLTAARNVMGDARARTFQPVDIRIGKQVFRNVPGIEADEPPGALGHLDGIVGPTALGITRLRLEWERKSLGWEAD
jgi:predicted aspartyl protease